MNNIRTYNNQQLSNFYHFPNKNKLERKSNYVDYSYLEVVEKNINDKLDNILKGIVEIKEIKMKMNCVQNLLSDFRVAFKKLFTLVEGFKIISEDNSRKEKKPDKDEFKIKEKELNKKEKIYLDGSKVCLEKLKINNFISLKNPNDLKIKYYEPCEIEDEREKITESIKYNIGEYYLPDEEKILYESAGNFLYSVGGISRKSLSLANNIYSELYNEYKKYLQHNNEWLKLNHEEDRRNLSIWVKNCLDEQHFCKYYSNEKSKEIEPYLYSKDEKTNNILKGLFCDLLKIQTKCLLSIPLVKAEFTNNNCKFENNLMLDIIFKGKKKKSVNFCYLPGLISNNQFIKGGKYYVFTYIEGLSYQKKDIIFNDETAVQHQTLYSLPISLNSLKLDYDINNYDNNYYEIKFKTKPLICSELKPCFSLLTIENRKVKENKNDTGIFLIEKNSIKNKYSLKISDYLKRNKNFDDLYFCK